MQDEASDKRVFLGEGWAGQGEGGVLYGGGEQRRRREMRRKRKKRSGKNEVGETTKKNYADGKMEKGEKKKKAKKSVEAGEIMAAREGERRKERAGAGRETSETRRVQGRANAIGAAAEGQQPRQARTR